MLVRGIVAGLILLGLAQAEYRSYDGSNNNLDQPDAGKVGTPFLRNQTASFVGDNQPFPSLDFANTSTSCAAGPGVGNFPMGRCVSDMLMSYHTNHNNVTARQAFLSKEGRTHMVTAWGHIVSLDLADSSGSIPYTIQLPTDDAQYQSPGTSALNGSVPFNQTAPMAGPGGQPIRTGVNMVTPFLDASFIYGIDPSTVQRLREPQGCRMLVSKGKDGQDYPPLQQQNSSRYDFGATSTRAQDAMVALFITIFIREHNNFCASLKQTNPAISDNDAFEQTRAYIIALVQHITYTEYLGTILGQTLQPPPGPDSYNPRTTPGIDTFFATASFRYGHSELSDYYQVLDKNDQFLTTLNMQDLRNARLVEEYGLETIARLCARQTQEEVDIYYSDEARNSYNVAGRPFDLAQLDILRGRDHGIPLYNDARKQFGLTPKASFAEISSDPTIQKTLQTLYETVDRVETIVGALLEDHGPGSNLGELFWNSIYQQFWNIRSSDRFWYTRPGVLSSEVLAKVRNTTLRSLFLGHFKDGSTLPANIWKYSQKNDMVPTLGNFLIQFTPTYKISWVTKSDSITFTMTLEGEVGWAGMGIAPGPHMSDAVFYIVDNGSGGLRLQKYISQGAATIPKLDRHISDIPIPTSGKSTVISWDHPLNDNGIRITSTANLYVLYAQSSTKQLRYHGAGDSHGSYSVNFFTSAISAGLSNSPINTHKYHGIGMFLCWGVAFPLSVFIVRYHKHSLSNAINIHRYIQVLTGVSITSLATAAISTSTPGRGQAHKYVGVTILAAVVGQLGLGIVVIYTLERIEHANRGVALVIKWMHRVLGSTLLVMAWFNIYLGMVAYPSPRNWIIAYLVYLAVMIVSVCIYHVYWHKTGKVGKGIKAIRVGDYLTPGSKRSLKKLPTSWPKMSWNEINERVLSGAKLVVVDDYVFDIRSWINSHPGGAKVLQRVIGTDITADLYGHYDDEREASTQSGEKGLLDDGEMEMSSIHNSHRSSPSFGSGSSQTGLLASQEFTTNLPKELAYLENLPTATSISTSDGPVPNTFLAKCRRLSLYVAEDSNAVASGTTDDPLAETPTFTERITEKLRQLQRFIDRLNTNSTTTIRSSAAQPLRRPLTTHAHSIRAVARLATYCIAQLDRNPKDNDFSVVGLSTARRESTIPFGYSRHGGSLDLPSSQPTQRKRVSVAMMPVPVIQVNRVFHRYIITSKATVSNEHASRPVRRFTFRSVQPWNANSQGQRKPFLPGDFVEIQCVAQGQVMTRAYTPIEGNMEEFTILVRIYPFGLVSRFLDKKFPGYEVRVRGPFDQAMRQRAKGDYLGSGGYDSGGDNPGLEEDEFGKPAIQRALLNPADPERGCWSLLLMVAGGTGLTPMLQLIQHHLHYASTLDRNFSMYLLYLNQSHKDIIAGPYLDTLVQQSNGMLHITYAIKEVPKTADLDYVGELNTSMLQRWLLSAAKLQRRRCGMTIGISDPSNPTWSPLHSPTSGSGLVQLANLSSLSNPTTPTFPLQPWPSQQQCTSSGLVPAASTNEIQQQQSHLEGVAAVPPPIPPRIQHHDSDLQYLPVDNDDHISRTTTPPVNAKRTVSYADLPSPGLPRPSSEQVIASSMSGTAAGTNLQERVEYWKVLCRSSSRLVVSGPPQMMECASDALTDLRFPNKNRIFMS